MVNHLWTMHYHLGLICTHCLDYKDNDSGDEDEFMLKED